MEITYVVSAIVVGVGATLFMDVWALCMKHVFSVPLANYCLVGRWVCHMPEGIFVHASIGAAPQRRSECVVGWSAHYVIGARTQSCSSPLVQATGLQSLPCCQPCYSVSAPCSCHI